MSRPIAMWTRHGKGGGRLCTVELYVAGDEPEGYHAERSDDGRTAMVWRFVGSGPIIGPSPRPGRQSRGLAASSALAPAPSAPGPDDLPPPGSDLSEWRRSRRQARRSARVGSMAGATS